jgi:ubiquitin-protein ligase
MFFYCDLELLTSTSLFLCSFPHHVKPVEQRTIMSHMRNTSALGASLTTSTSHYTSSRPSNSPSIKALQLEYSKLQKEPVEGFTVQLDESNLCRWHGRRTTHERCWSLETKTLLFRLKSGHLRATRYALRRWLLQSRHGISKYLSICSTQSKDDHLQHASVLNVLLGSFPHQNVASEYLRVSAACTSILRHSVPLVHRNGEVCISILHPPTEDPQSGEHPSERWNPTQNVRTILMSIISLLNEPNCSSPANVDAR